MSIAARCLRPGGRGCGVAAAGRPRLGKAGDGRRWDEVIQGHSVPRTFIPKLIGLNRDGRFPYDDMLSYFAFEEIGEAFKQMKSAHVVKPVLVMTG
jgi:aryl-alcohol dehydrogenase